MIGPSPIRAKGGMSTVIQEIYEDKIFEDDCKIDIYESYIDGNRIKAVLFSIWSFLKFWILGKSKNYDIYHIHVASRGSTFRKMLYAALIKKQNKKLILHIHGGQYLEFYDGLSKRNKKKVLSFLKSANIVIALSEQWKANFESFFKLNNCIILENGIDLEKYYKARKEPIALNKQFLFLGRVSVDKGIYELIKAVSIVKKEYLDICVYVGGEGDILGAEKYITECGAEKNIKLIGWLDEEKKIDVLSKVNTLILPSHYEALPMSILEAMACGKAIISTKVGAIPEIVQEDNGILINVGEVDELVNAIKKCCEDLSWMKRVYNANQKKIYDLYNMKEKHEKLKQCYEKLNKDNQ